MTCDEAELNIEMRLHGAAPDDSALRQHLSECASCRRFETASANLETSMKEAGALAEKTIDWNAVQARVQRTVRRYRWEERAPIAVLALVCGVLAVKRLPLEPAALILAGIAPLCAFAWLHLRGLSRGAREARAGAAQALRWARDDLDRRIGERRKVLAAHVALAAGVALALLFDALPHAGLQRVPLILLLAISLADTVYGLFIDLPRLQRERREFD